MNHLGVIRLREANDSELPFARRTIYKWHSSKKHPQLVYTIPGLGLCLDLHELEKMKDAAKAASIASSRRIHESLS